MGDHFKPQIYLTCRACQNIVVSMYSILWLLGWKSLRCHRYKMSEQQLKQSKYCRTNKKHSGTYLKSTQCFGWCSAPWQLSQTTWSDFTHRSEHEPSGLLWKSKLHYRRSVWWCHMGSWPGQPSVKPTEESSSAWIRCWAMIPKFLTCQTLHHHIYESCLQVIIPNQRTIRNGCTHQCQIGCPSLGPTGND